MTDNVTIVAKTKYSNKFCIGALSNSGESLRLLPSHSERFHPSNTPLAVGDNWKIEYERNPKVCLPHTEDVIVIRKTKIGTNPSLKSFILSNITPYKSNLGSLFDGTLQNHNNKLYVPGGLRKLPDYSTCFCLCNTNLIKTLDFGRVRYLLLLQKENYYSIKYVGILSENKLPDEIPAGTLLRFSLSGKWGNGKTPVGYWLQLSGWYS